MPRSLHLHHPPNSRADAPLSLRSFHHKKRKKANNRTSQTYRIISAHPHASGAMGSDNPKGAVAKESVAMQAGKYVGIGAMVVVLYVCLSTAPSTTGPVAVGVEKNAADGGGVVLNTQQQGGGGVGVGGRRAGDGRGALAARYRTDGAGGSNGKTVGDVAVGGGDHVTAQALPKLGGGGGGAGASSSSSAMGASKSAASTGAFGKTSSTGGDPTVVAPATGLYALHAVDIDGVDTALSFLQGKITLVVNVASE